MEPNRVANQLAEVAFRIKEMRGICGFTEEEMSQKTDTTMAEYLTYEAGRADLPFTFIHKCALAFGIGITDLLEGHSANLRSYTVTRRGEGQQTAKEEGIEISNLAPFFRNKLAEPYYCTYEYDEAQQRMPIHLTTHAGQEFDIILSGQLKVQVGENTEILGEGDSILYNSSTPHGMIAVGGRPCVFCAVVISGEKAEEMSVRRSIVEARSSAEYVCKDFISAKEDEHGVLQSLDFPNADRFNFAFDCVDAIAAKYPEKLAMLHLDRDKNERRLTFSDISRASSRAANYFKALGIKRGDRVMLVLKRHYQFWFAILGLHKLGAIAIPATNQLQEHDFSYRFNAAEVSAIVCTADGDTAQQVDIAQRESPSLKLKILVGGQREGWHDFDEEYTMYRSHFPRGEDAPCGDDLMLMFFTSGTTGYPKIAAHSYKYALGHYITAKYWHCVHADGLHFTISETGWGKALWGKLYGQWLCEGAVFTYDFDRFDAADILPMFKKYNITTFCAPPTMYRMFIKDDLSKYDLSSIRHATTAGEALNPEVFRQFEAQTGLQIYEGFGQTETTLTIGNLIGNKQKIGSMGKPIPTYDLVLVDENGEPVAPGENGEICIRAKDGELPCGLFAGYYRDEGQTKEVWHDGLYHTRDVAWQDEDGYLWYVGRRDDVIKSSGYRIGPFEIESVIMELPYVLECGVSAAPDELRGQVVKASIVLVKGTEGTEELKKEIQSYVKKHTAPYKYPRIVVFRDELPKTISGKIQRNKL
ncbi:MAG: AMP-binding protein [Oscillospiraceae bacterium]|jgi:acetyl-CoA synthetase|nr:AMP-binding protein [Oscillospiraceae bacterium]